jgi:L,D-peptidoglycan transpeptidase YkuD (ErfK/YbiS/YcfS/YnhG family)
VDGRSPAVTGAERCENAIPADVAGLLEGGVLEGGVLEGGVVRGGVVGGSVTGGTVVCVVTVVGAGAVVGAAVARAAALVPEAEQAPSRSTSTSAGTGVRPGVMGVRGVRAPDLRYRQMRPRPPVLLVVLVAAVAAVAGGCGASSPRASVSSTGAPTTVAAATTVARTTVASTTTVAPTAARSTAAPSTAAPSTAPATAAPTTTARPATGPPPAPPSFVTRLVGVGNAGQVIAVAAAGYGLTTATFTAYQRTANGWQQVFGPWTAHVGRNGFAPPGAKREGDGRTPSGSYGFSFFFGVRSNPGVHFPYRSIGGPWIVWDRTQAGGVAPEPMDRSPVYDYGAVIDYNSSRVPGLGSAIFFHVSSGGSTAGCVSLPVSELVPVLRWLDPGRSPRIIIGTTATIAS